MRNAKTSLAGSRRLWIGAAVIAAIVIAVLTQQALAEGVGGWLAGVWVGVLELVLAILAPLFGG